MLIAIGPVVAVVAVELVVGRERLRSVVAGIERPYYFRGRQRQAFVVCPVTVRTRL